MTEERGLRPESEEESVRCGQLPVCVAKRHRFFGRNSWFAGGQIEVAPALSQHIPARVGTKADAGAQYECGGAASRIGVFVATASRLA